MKKQILYIYPNRSSFINNDISFLQKKYKVITQDLDWGNASKLPFNIIKQFSFLLFNTSQSKAIIVSFGGYFSLLPTIFGKIFNTKTFIILNGTDSVSFPIYNYGSLRISSLKFFIRYSCKLATELWPVDESLIHTNYTYDASVIHKSQGIKAFFPELKTPTKVIPNGLDIAFWNMENKEISSDFITVAFIDNLKAFNFKGIDMIFKMAEKFPLKTFTIVGMSDSFKKTLDDIPKNIIIFNYLTPEHLKTEYLKNTYYIQASMNEGFGCALAEAMLCGCIPIVSYVGALPNVVGNIGLKVKCKSIDNWEEILNKALHFTNEEKQKLAFEASKIISEKFNITQRERLILQEIDK